MSDLDRAIATIEESRQTHVNWAEWRRKGNGTDTDHEMIGDLEWHEAAIRDYDHVLAVLRAAPRAEGLDVERLALAMCRAFHGEDCAVTQYDAEQADQVAAEYARLSRPSDERVPPLEIPSYDGKMTASLGQGQDCVLVQIIRDGQLQAGIVLKPHDAEDMARSLMKRAEYAREPSDERVPESEER